MGDFKFEFLDSSHDESVTNKCETQDTNALWLPAKEVLPTERVIKEIDDIILRANMFICGDLEIGHVYPEEALRYLKEDFNGDDLDNCVLSAENQHSDLVTAKYEGGLKVWECTADLANYLSEHESKKLRSSLVMDLGCGAGILGILALMSGAKADFQDYNEEVINAVTIPNVVLNLGDFKEDVLTRSRFFCGDWGSLSALMENDSDKYKYDFIFTSETIYNTENYSKLYNFIKSRLKKGGSAYVAAKTYYFGVGGSTREFEKVVKCDGRMRCDVCWRSTGGVQREIIKITFLENI